MFLSHHSEEVLLTSICLMSLQKESERLSGVGLSIVFHLSPCVCWRICICVQISTEESTFSPVRPVALKPLKPALKRPSVVERPTEIPTSKKRTNTEFSSRTLSREMRRNKQNETRIDDSLCLRSVCNGLCLYDDITNSTAVSFSLSRKSFCQI